MISRETREVEVKELRPYDKNMNKGTNVDMVKKSIEEFGYNNYIVVDEDFNILVGHSRYKAIIDLGRDKCFVTIVSGLSENDKKAYRIADNQTKKKNTTDYFNLKVELREIGDSESMQSFFPELNFGSFLDIKMCARSDVDIDDMTKAYDHIDNKFEDLVKSKEKNIKKHKCPYCEYEFDTDINEINGAG